MTASATRRADPPAPAPARTGLRLALSWGLVSVPLVWGVYQTVVKSLALFE
ncbi:MAG: hypothetical protein AVDCRST_MAG11-2486 [uncultured Gemmatimonadaceae bacterium]|uniref:Oxalate:formate antiporter n=1 Tax=uncultured Gemmatimonadaceae bacterium TaxID=246130 RepID=A0A6J4LE99_9BACT|nr:MAG: hypothetical protein AVDCRST_MAG11-2486 [uncultured Gemmatimonadaceae bacterium]